MPLGAPSYHHRRGDRRARIHPGSQADDRPRTAAL